jgi:hypothetical protein
MQTLQVVDPARSQLVKDLKSMFTILYNWSFNLADEKDDQLLQTFGTLVDWLIPRWRTVMGNNKSRNYYHYIQYEALRVSIFMDITSSLQIDFHRN